VEPDAGAEAGVDDGAEAGAAAVVSVFAAGALASAVPDPDSEAGSLLLGA